MEQVKKSLRRGDIEINLKVNPILFQKAERRKDKLQNTYTWVLNWLQVGKRSVTLDGHRCYYTYFWRRCIHLCYLKIRIQTSHHLKALAYFIKFCHLAEIILESKGRHREKFEKHLLHTLNYLSDGYSRSKKKMLPF